MPPTRRTKKAADAHPFWSLFPNGWAWPGDTRNDSDYSRPLQDDSESSSDDCSITSGDDQVLAEGRAAEDVATDSEEAAEMVMYWEVPAEDNFTGSEGAADRILGNDSPDEEDGDNEDKYVC
jgi:hypothetical protein